MVYPRNNATAAQFDAIFALNARAPFLLMQGCCALMEAAGTRGSVVNIGSVHAHGGMEKLAAYAAAKGALLTMTRNLAFAKRRHGIRANYIALGWTATPAEHACMAQEHPLGAEGWLQVADASHPLGRIYRPSDVASLVTFLMSDDAQMLTADCIDLHEKFFGTWE